MDKPHTKLEASEDKDGATFHISLKQRTVYFLCVLVAFAVLVLVYLSVRPDHYLSKLRTQYSDDLISEADKSKLTPLEYNVKRLVFEEALDVFLNPALTTEERKRIARIIVDKESGFRTGVEQGIVAESRAHRAYEKFERAKAMGITEMAKQSTQQVTP